MSAYSQYILKTHTEALTPTWVPFSENSYFDNECLGMFVEGGNLYVFGMFNNVSGIYAHAIAKWDGNVWSEPFPGLVGYPNELIKYNDEFYAMGTYVGSSSAPYKFAAKWNGVEWISAGTAGTQAIQEQSSRSTIILYDKIYSTRVRNVNGQYGSILSSFYNGEWHNEGGTVVEGTPVATALGVVEFNNKVMSYSVSHLLQFDGVDWTLPSGYLCSTNSVISDIIKFNNKLYAVGGFTAGIPSAPGLGDYSLTNLNGMMKWDGLSWTNVAGSSAIGYSSTVPQINKLCVYKDKLFISGANVVTVSGRPSLGMVYLDSDDIVHPVNSDVSFVGYGYSAISSNHMVVYDDSLISIRNYAQLDSKWINRRGERCNTIVRLAM